MDLVAWAVALWLRLDPPPPPCPRKYPCAFLGVCMRRDKGGPCDRRPNRTRRGATR